MPRSRLTLMLLFVIIFYLYFLPLCIERKSILLYLFIINGSTGDSIDCNVRTPLYVYAGHVKLFSYHTNMHRNTVSYVQGDHSMRPKVGEPEHGPTNRCVLMCAAIILRTCSFPFLYVLNKNE